MDRFIYIFKKRIDLTNSNRLIIQTGSCAEYMKDVKAVSYVNGKERPVKIFTNPQSSFWFVYKNAEPEYDGEYLLAVDLDEGACDVRIELTKETYPAGREVIKLTGRDIDRLRKVMELNLVSAEKSEENGESITRITGWTECAGAPLIDVTSRGKKLNYDLRLYRREDIVSRYPAGEIFEDCGFELIIHGQNPSKVTITAQCDKRKNSIDIKLASGKDKENDKLRQKLALNNRTSYFKRAVSYVAVYGLKRFIVKVFNKLTKKAERGCHAYFKATTPNEVRLNEQRAYKFANRPKFSFIIPVYRPNQKFFTAMIDSIVGQTYDNWEICLADGGGEKDVSMVVADYMTRLGADRIKYVKLEDNLGIADNTNAALKLATGDYIVFGDHDDEIHASALFEVMRAMEKDPEIDFIYTDEDKIIEDTGKHTQAHLKPDFNLEFLRHNNYICHLVVAKKELIERVGDLIGEYNGAQDYDYVLRCTEQAKRIHHIPKILYHWRISKNSTAKKTTQKSYADDAGKNALIAHLNRMGVKATVNSGFVPGFYEPEYLLDNEPLVSVIIPNKDHIDDLNQCLKSLFEVSDYKNIECIIVENNSTEAATFEAYKILENEHPGQVKTVFYKGDFNYSDINNFGVNAAKGEYILLLNNDTEIVTSDAIRRMVSQCSQPGVGAVGAKLLYEDNTIQHAGIVVGYQGVAGHAFVGEFDDNYGYFGRAMASQEVSAVTAACLLTTREVYDKVGGLDVTFKVAFNDMDFCMKIRQAGYKIIYEANAKLHHYESKSRGSDDTADKQVRFYGEVMRFERKWHDVLYAGDPYYNANMDLIGKVYNIKELN